MKNFFIMLSLFVPCLSFATNLGVRGPASVKGFPGDENTVAITILKSDIIAVSSHAATKNNIWMTQGTVRIGKGAEIEFKELSLSNLPAECFVIAKETKTPNIVNVATLYFSDKEVRVSESMKSYNNKPNFLSFSDAKYYYCGLSTVKN